ncbi:MAG TPA: hypothetical protein VNO30_41410 [Kofleriaceae bacterium]|nr:hypothetical protein [Kofleriaceae bacterium]
MHQAATQSTQTGEPSVSFGLASGSPLEWLMGTVRVSAYVGFGQHWAVRADFATQDTQETGQVITGPLLGAVLGESGDFARFPRVNDYGLGIAWYPRRLWDGFLLDVSAFYRGAEPQEPGDFRFRNRHNATIGAGSAVIGWSWRLHENMFIAFAMGLSASLEYDDIHTSPEHTPPSTSMYIGGTSYLRLGVVFGR